MEQVFLRSFSPSNEQHADPEALIFYCLSGLAVRSKTEEDRREIGKLLEYAQVRHPYHPGVLHYLIHSYDTPKLASKGLEAAYRYGQVAPDVPHALHMPSHIFERLGLWYDSLSSNVRALKAAIKYSQALYGREQSKFAVDEVLTVVNTTAAVNSALIEPASQQWEGIIHPLSFLMKALAQTGQVYRGEVLPIFHWKLKML